MPAFAGGSGNFQRAADTVPAATWPAASSTGPTKAFGVTQTGKLYDRVSSITADGGFVGGVGTLTDPYLIDSVHYTTESVIGSSAGPTDLTGKYMRFTNCWFQSAVTTGDTGTSKCMGHGVNGRTDALPAFVTYEDCLFAPSGSPVVAGGPDPSTGGFAYCLFSNLTPFKLLRCNLWGAAVNIAIVNQGSVAARSFIQDSWSHDQWDSAGAHTDNIVSNDPTNASNVTIDHCNVEGKCGARTPTGRVVNVVAIYSAQPVTGWVINNSRVAHGDFGFYYAAPGDPDDNITGVTITNNVIDNSDLGTVLHGHTDAGVLTQSGNVDQSGTPVTF